MVSLLYSALFNGYWGCFPEINVWDMMLTTHPHAECKNKQSYASTPPNALKAWTETTLPPLFLQKLSTDVHYPRHGVCVTRGKAVPLQAWSGPEGSRMLRFPDFMTTAQDDGKVVSLKHRPPLPPGNAPGTHFC